jgi:hypothetical protein
MERASKTLRPVCLIMLSGLAAAPADAGEKHVHGDAALEVAVDGNRLQLGFRSPLDNLIGFEHAPRTDKQNDAVRRMAAELNKPAQQFVPTAEARCTPEPVRLASEVIDPSLLGGAARPADAGKFKADTARDKHGQKGDKGHDGHAGLEATFVFRCEQPGKLSSLEVTLFDAFKGLKRIDVQVAGARRQAAARLTPKNRRISW